MSLTQGLEAFDQRKYRPKDKEANFVMRIKRLCQQHTKHIEPIIGDIDAFAESVRDSRHYYTHHDEATRSKGRVVFRSKLTMMTYHLQFLFRVCVLAEFELDADPHSVMRRHIPCGVTEFF